MIVALILGLLWQEEHPPIISNVGMGSVLVNYYRKKDDKDDHIPKVRRKTTYICQCENLNVL